MCVKTRTQAELDSEQTNIVHRCNKKLVVLRRVNRSSLVVSRVFDSANINICVSFTCSRYILIFVITRKSFFHDARNIRMKIYELLFGNFSLLTFTFCIFPCF